MIGHPGLIEHQAKRMPMLFSPSLVLMGALSGLPHHAGVDFRTLDSHRDAAVTSLIPTLSCHSRRPHAPFAELVTLSRTSIADEIGEHARRVLGEHPIALR